MSTTDYLQDEYTSKIRTLLKEVQAEARERGYLCEDPHDMTDEEIRLSVLVQPAGTTPDEAEGVDVGITLLESECADGTKGGCNFGLDVIGYNGIIVGSLVPFNYTENVWVPRESDEAVAKRWRVFNEVFCPSAILDEIDRFYQEQTENVLRLH